MKFTRFPRYEGITLTPRQIANASRRIEKQSQKLIADYPLFSSQMEKPAPLDAERELEKRQLIATASEKRIRSLYARVWRESRRDYANATPQQRAAIRDTWSTWAGPLTSLYFRYVVDEHTGVNEARSRAFRETLQAERQKCASIPQTASLFC